LESADLRQGESGPDPQSVSGVWIGLRTERVFPDRPLCVKLWKMPYFTISKNHMATQKFMYSDPKANDVQNLKSSNVGRPNHSHPCRNVSQQGLPLPLRYRYIFEWPRGRGSL